MLRELNKEGLEHIKQWEGFREKAELIDNSVWVIGYSHTSDKSNIIDSPHEGMTISEDKATKVLLADLKPYQQVIEDEIITDITDSQYAAILSFIFNVGIENFKNSTLLKKINDDLLDEVPNELSKWVYTTVDGKKVISLGLVRRRVAETSLWNKGQFVASEFIEPVPHKESIWSKPETWGMIIPSVAGLVGFADGNGPFQWALSGIMVIASLIGMTYFIKKIRKNST